MIGMRPSPMQRTALALVEAGELQEAEEICRVVDVHGGFHNEAEFIYRLLCRGWIRLEITEEGHRALDS